MIQIHPKIITQICNYINHHEPGKRIMLKVNIDDVEKADDIFTLLMGEEVESRRNFIQKHALEVSPLNY